MANIKTAYSTLVTFTKTNANLAQSNTAGWKGQVIDNTSDLMLDFLIHIELAAVNTAVDLSKSIYLFAYGLVDETGSAYTSTGDGTPDGSEGTITFANISTTQIVMPVLGVIPYPVQNKAINAGPFSFRQAFGGELPPKFGPCMLNTTPMTLNVTNIKGRPVYKTVA